MDSAITNPSSQLSSGIQELPNTPEERAVMQRRYASVVERMRARDTTVDPANPNRSQSVPNANVGSTTPAEVWGRTSTSAPGQSAVNRGEGHAADVRTSRGRRGLASNDEADHDLAGTAKEKTGWIRRIFTPFNVVSVLLLIALSGVSYWVWWALQHSSDGSGAGSKESASEPSDAASGEESSDESGSCIKISFFFDFAIS